MKIIECTQGTEDWFNARRGIATASRFDQIITAKTMKPAAAIDTLICELIAEIVTPGSIMPDKYISPAMANGTALEPEARRWLEFDKGLDVQQVGFITTDDGRFGASPDGLIGEDAGLELKCPETKTHVEYLLDGTLPDKYRAQVHGSMIVTGRKSWWFMSYNPNLEPLLLHVKRDAFTVALEAAMKEFWRRFVAAKEKLHIKDREALTPAKE